jgi:asparagine synthase (glutamine-hydrolysing)
MRCVRAVWPTEVGALAAVAWRGGVPPGTVERMLEAAPHRGDRAHVLTDGDVAIGVVHRAGYADASVGRHARFSVALAGRLDEDPRRGRGHPPTSSDAQRLAEAWADQGPDVVARLRGAYAATVTDGERLWAFRDHFGNRPLFSYHDSDRWVVATEVKQVVAGASLPRSPDLDHLHRLLTTGAVESTAIQGVRRLRRARLTEGRAGGTPRATRYWNPRDLIETDTRSFPEAAEGLWHHLQVASRRPLTGADVLQLSGGLDSTAIAGCIADAPGVRALTYVYPDHPSVDESRWTRLVADHLGLDLTSVVSQVTGLEDLERYVRLTDGPVELIALPEVAESYALCAGLGARTVLDGQVAEFLLSVSSYVFDHLVTHGRVAAAGRVVRSHHLAGRPWGIVARSLRRSFTPTAVHGWRHRRRIAQGRVHLHAVPSWMDRAQMFEEVREVLPLHARIGARERWRYLQTQPLEGESPGFEADDVLAAAAGVEVRRPFADVDLWEYVLALRAEVRYRDHRRKPLLREAMRGRLPDAVVDREDKTVFDEAMLAACDYPTLRTYLKSPPERMRGVDYELLNERIEREVLDAKELQWARDLAKIHAFLLTF